MSIYDDLVAAGYSEGCYPACENGRLCTYHEGWRDAMDLATQRFETEEAE